MSWDRIRGQAGAIQTFLSAVQRGRLGQAYLLVGPEGVGKRRFAWELAKAMLCERPPALLTACDRCPACTQASAETHPDVLSLRTPEEKSEMPVDVMRAFCSQLMLKPVRGGRKIGIVEDADDFNPESANTFLKTLEEPPPGSILLLIATSADRQLPTILSRCQLVRFGLLSPADLSAVLTAEGVADGARRDRLVKMSGGSVSRALALHDDAAWGVRDQLIRGIASARPDFVQLAATWWRFVEAAGKETASQRIRMSAVIGFVVEALRQALRLSLGAAAAGIDPAEQEMLRNYARRLGPNRLHELIDRCLEADYHVERRVQLILIVESLLHQFCSV